jgi:uncharacterized protein RhaS with RHS repeats
MYYYGYRYYEPNLQRWLNRDPIQEKGGINLYQFVGNNALKYLDAFGRQTTLQIPLGGMYEAADPSLEMENFYESQWDKEPNPNSGAQSTAATALGKLAEIVKDEDPEGPSDNRNKKAKCSPIMAPYSAQNAPPNQVTGPLATWPTDPFSPANIPPYTPPTSPTLSTLPPYTPPTPPPPGPNNIYANAPAFYVPNSQSPPQFNYWNALGFRDFASFAAYEASLGQR